MRSLDSLAARRRRYGRLVTVGALVAAQLVLGQGPATAAPGVLDEAVSFSVKNVNTSKVPCSSDGASYTVAGHLVGPAAALGGAAPHAAALYLHGLGFGEFFWNFSGVSGYDYATAEALAGHTSVVIDRLGYGASGHPVGSSSCLGAQADIAHQIVQQLRNGSYAAAGGVKPAFSRVALAGHSAGGAIAEIEAYSFHDIDGLIVMAYADLGASPAALIQFATTGGVCLGGGQPAGPGQPGGYGYFGQTPQDFQAAMFHHADPSVVAAVTALRNRDPCGDINSFPQALVLNPLSVPTIKVPVLLVFGANDALFPPPAGSLQRLLFSGSSDVRSVLLNNTGHAVTVELSAPTLRDDTCAWLAAHGF
jgi:pimeloyl-ACP methyl ester carboxylesterase